MAGFLNSWMMGASIKSLTLKAKSIEHLANSHGNAWGIGASQGAFARRAFREYGTQAMIPVYVKRWKQRQRSPPSPAASLVHGLYNTMVSSSRPLSWECAGANATVEAWALLNNAGAELTWIIRLTKISTFMLKTVFNLQYLPRTTGHEVWLAYFGCWPRDCLTLQLLPHVWVFLLSGSTPI